MISFRFKISKPFLDAQDHPITIPSEHQYRLRDEGALSKMGRIGEKIPVTIVDSQGRRFEGHIFYGEAGGRYFYQIRMGNEASVTMRSALKNEEAVQVFVGMVNHQTQVYLVDGKREQHISKFTGHPGPQAEARLIEELEKMTEKFNPFT